MSKVVKLFKVCYNMAVEKKGEILKMSNGNGGKGSIIGTIMIIAGIFLAPVGIGIIMIIIGYFMFKGGYK